MKYIPDTKNHKNPRITVLRLILLRAIDKSPGISAERLIEETGVTTDTVRPTMRILVKEGFVTRPDEPRFMLSRKGQKLLSDVRGLLS